MSNSSIIQVRNLYKTYRAGDVDVHALQGANLDVAKGEFVSIVGASGSGKSTLFNILGALTPPTSGTVRIDGKDLKDLSNAERTKLRRNTVGFVFQKYNLLPTLTTEDNIRIVQFIGDGTTQFTPEFQEILNILGIADRMKYKPRALSGGQQQRVAIARALVNRPAILLADEPTGNLDSQNSKAVLGLLADLNRRLGQTILMITHDQEAASYAGRSIHMRDGQILGSDPFCRCLMCVDGVPPFVRRRSSRLPGWFPRLAGSGRITGLPCPTPKSASPRGLGGVGRVGGCWPTNRPELLLGNVAWKILAISAGAAICWQGRGRPSTKQS
jgi:putative ABC transport system ATP-binding protein